MPLKAHQIWMESGIRPPQGCREVVSSGGDKKIPTSTKHTEKRKKSRLLLLSQIRWNRVEWSECVFRQEDGRCADKISQITKHMLE